MLSLPRAVRVGLALAPADLRKGGAKDFFQVFLSDLPGNLDSLHAAEVGNGSCKPPSPDEMRKVPVRREVPVSPRFRRVSVRKANPTREPS
jgi:hypothetical protein